MSVLSALVSLVTLAFASCLHPSAARCPDHWWLATGVKADGSFECWSPPPGDDWRGEYGPIIFASRVFCASGSAPVTADGTRVFCQHGAGMQATRKGDER